MGDFKESCVVQGDDEFQNIAHGLRDLRDYIESIDDSCHALIGGEHPKPLEVSGSFDSARLHLNQLNTTIASFFAQIEAVHDRMLKGEEGARIDASLFAGFWRVAAKNINAALELIEKPLAEAADVCHAAGEGDFSIRIRERRTGLPERVRTALNAAFSNHETMVKQLRTELQGLLTSHEETGRATRVKSQLLASVCSIFQTFLKNTLKATSVIRTDGLPENQRNAVFECRQSSAAMLAFTEELVGYAQIDQGQVTVSQSSFDLHKILFEAKDILRPHVVKRRQEFRLTIDPSVPEIVIGDPSLLKGAVVNVAMQSIRYTDEDGSVTVRAELVDETSETYTVMFSISDSSDALLRRRDDALKTYSIDDLNLQTHTVFGTGLGLLVAEGIVELIGGSIKRESHNGVGGRCHFSLPFLKALPSSKPAVRVSDSEMSGSEDAASYADVLVVEDNVVNQKLASALLRKRGCSVTIAEDGEEALRRISEKKFDLVLMDIQLPLLDGFEVTQRIRASGKEYADVPIVALTAHALTVDDTTYMGRGLNAYLLKPLEPKALWDVFASLGIHLRIKSDNPPVGALSPMTEAAH